MPAGSIERTNARKEEIINACEKLYQTMSFKDAWIGELCKAMESNENMTDEEISKRIADTRFLYIGILQKYIILFLVQRLMIITAAFIMKIHLICWSVTWKMKSYK